ncbi:uncharacterized protein CCOS01_12762 [Colletotrichum costaricense]|uniref:Uncharacterized protein n=1 Tax=Colletotrichum costaricense TaxID=1209916 RepID=A0AAI9YNU9_9PEZI|nr:uncharacterized protein CCOS01_12762 [Colletotrichum costaricense]KAK1517213.1 hypothetical protein CCOS01_12762 [Colletotrichum costaricense]
MAEPTPSEDGTFKNVSVTSSQESLQQFQDDFSGSHTSRREIIKRLHYTINLPPVSEKRMKKLQSTREAAANDAAFTQAIMDLFQLLSDWKTGDITLVVRVASPSDTDEDLFDSLDSSHSGSPIWDVRNDFQYISFDQTLNITSGLAQVRAISSVDLREDFSNVKRRLHPACITTISQALPDVKSLTWDCIMPSRRLKSSRREIRLALAETLKQSAFTNLKGLDIYLEDPDPLNESSDPGAFCQSPEEDVLSLAISRILQLPAIVKVQLTGLWTIAPAAFETATEFGSLLESVNIEASGTTPDGKWLSIGEEEDDVDQNEPDSDSDASEAVFDSSDSDTSDFVPEHEWEREAGNFPANSWRTSIDTEVFLPHILPLVKTTLRMSPLRTLRYEIHMQPSPFFVEYYAPGVENVSAKRGSNRRGHFERENASRSRWYLTVVQGFDASWTVPPDMISAIEETGGCYFWDGPNFPHESHANE